MHIYRADLRDLGACLALDASYETEYVWQVTQREEQDEVVTRLRTVQLPRSMRVRYPPWNEALLAHQERGDLILVAAEATEVRGYIDLQCLPDHGIGWVHHLIIAPAHRRQGLGKALLGRALQHARQLGMIKAMGTVQSKNHPAITFVQHNGFSYCGYNERYYRNQDIALYFVCGL